MFLSFRAQPLFFVFFCVFFAVFLTVFDDTAYRGVNIFNVVTVGVGDDFFAELLVEATAGDNSHVGCCFFYELFELVELF